MRDNVLSGEAIKRVASFHGLALEYKQPDASAESIHTYRSAEGQTIKQVLRYRDEQGNKSISQRRPGTAGWIWNTDGVEPLLYNLPSITRARVVVITEGEKDADTINALQLFDTQRGHVAATTSGNAGSWLDIFADALIGKQVIVCPDADEAGERYRDAIVASLTKRNIEHRVLDFAPLGVNDVSDYLAGHAPEELILLLGEWVQRQEFETLIMSNIRYWDPTPIALNVTEHCAKQGLSAPPNYLPLRFNGLRRNERHYTFFS
jgi:5S rRNA maturation endonuclease (ribonuclease M5)